MANAAKETKEFYEPEDDGIYNIAVSGDGTWRRRGYTSAYGVITALSTLTGKVLDVEIMLFKPDRVLGGQLGLPRDFEIN